MVGSDKNRFEKKKNSKIEMKSTRKIRKQGEALDVLTFLFENLSRPKQINVLIFKRLGNFYVEHTGTSIRMRG